MVQASQHPWSANRDNETATWAGPNSPSVVCVLLVPNLPLCYSTVYILSNMITALMFIVCQYSNMYLTTLVCTATPLSTHFQSISISKHLITWFSITDQPCQRFWGYIFLHVDVYYSICFCALLEYIFHVMVISGILKPVIGPGLKYKNQYENVSLFPLFSLSL